MNPVLIPAESLKNTPKDLNLHGITSSTPNNQTQFNDLPLQARLLLAVPRARGRSTQAPLAERYVLDTLGRIIDAGPNRQDTISAVNLLALILLDPKASIGPHEVNNPKWLSPLENLVLCMLCKIQAGQHDEASALAQHCLATPSIEPFNVAATTLCSAECFKRGGDHVFTPSGQGMPKNNDAIEHSSVTRTADLSLGESLLLNAIRLRKRTLAYSRLSTKVVPLLCSYAALPSLQAVVDAHLIEILRNSARDTTVHCLCSRDISVGEAMFLASLSAFYNGNADRIEHQLSTWLPKDSVQTLQARSEEFKRTLHLLGTPVPTRHWDIQQLRAREALYKDCEHFSESRMTH